MTILGFDIGGTKSAVVFGNNKGEIFYKEKIATSSPQNTLGTLFHLADKIGLSADIAGVSCGGPLDEKNGIILSPPNLTGWDEIHITDLITKHFKIPAHLLNDANACALAEWKFGAGKGTQNMIFCTFGTGMGSGLILNGKLYSGTNGNAGEIGHIRMASNGPIGYGKKGSFEGFVSGGGIAQSGKIYARKKLNNGIACSFCKSMNDIDKITAKSIAEMADLGYEDAKEIYSTCGRYLGKGLAVAIDILNPECIVLGSIYARCEHLLANEMIKELKKECLPQSLTAVRIVPAKLGEQIGDYAALVAAMEGENER